MPFKHTSTELQVLAREEAKATATIAIGMQALRAIRPLVGTTADELYQQRKADCEEDARAIYDLLNEHLPEETRSLLAYLYWSGAYGPVKVEK